MNFLIHHDPLILALSYLQLLMVMGLALFFIAAVPLYYGRFTGKGVVSRSFYAKIRHPQYLFLAISGFGLLLYWPRLIILVMYVNMLFVYYLLARNEKWRMKQEAPGVYEEYMQNTSMFIPGEPGGRIYRLFFGAIKFKGIGIFLLYCLALIFSVFFALWIRAYTVNHLPLVRVDNMTVLPVFPRPSKELQELYLKVSSSEKVSSYLQDENAANLVYVFPSDFFLTALVTDEDRRFSDDIIERFPEVLEWHQYKFRGGLGKFFRIFYNYASSLGTVETDYDVERFIFVRSIDDTGKLVIPDDVFDLGIKRKPALLVDVDAHNHNIVTVTLTTGKHKCGAMPMPTF